MQCTFKGPLVDPQCVLHGPQGALGAYEGLLMGHLMCLQNAFIRPLKCFKEPLKDTVGAKIHGWEGFLEKRVVGLSSKMNLNQENLLV